MSLRQIAQSLGISHSTVSLAMRDHPRISAAVRQKVHETAAAMGYRPDPALTALAHYRKGRMTTPVQSALAWLNCWDEPGALRGYREFDGYWRGAEATARRFGYRLEEFVAGGERMPLARLEKVLETRNIRGLLIPPHPYPPRWADFHWEEFSVVRFGRSSLRPPSHLVTSDHVSNTLLAFQKMQERGYHRIGFVTGVGRTRFMHFAAGVELARTEAQKEAQLPTLVLPELIVPPHVARPTRTIPEEAALVAQRNRKLAAWLKRNRPDAILTDLAEMQQMLDSLRVRVPEDLGLVAESILDGNASAGIDQRPEEIGRVATLLLISLINDNERGMPESMQQVLVSGAWVDGPSLPARGG